MKHFNYRFLRIHQQELKNMPEGDLKRIMPYVISIASTFPKESLATGILDLNDLIQAGHLGLLQGWDKVDWKMIKESPNPDAQLWSFLKKRIRWAIRREIDKNCSIVSTPINKMEDKRNDLKLNYEDRVFVTIFPKLWELMVIEEKDVSPWISLQLEELIEDELVKVEKNVDNRNILLAFYGVGVEKKNQQELATLYQKSISNIQNIVFRTRGKLKTEHFENIIKEFYQN